MSRWSDTVLTISSHDAFLAALDAAREVTCEAYVLAPSMVGAFEAAAARGAHVRVRLEAAPYGRDGRLPEINRERVAELRAHGVDAALADGSDRVLHAKVALVDGVAWLDDRNFPRGGPDLIVRDDDPADTAAVAGALAGASLPGDRVALDKASALALEARALTEQTPATLDISSESFGYGPIEKLLREAIARGAHVRLLVSTLELHKAVPQELDALRLLAGAEIRARADVDKLAVTPACAWIGSANATGIYASDPQSDWGVISEHSAALAAVEARFESAWEHAATVALPPARGA